MKAAFIILTIVMSAAIIACIRYAAGRAYGQPGQGRVTAGLTAAIAAWLLYVAGVSYTGILNSTALPPRIPLFLIFPLFGFMAYFFSGKRFRPLVAAMPAAPLVYLQSFRILVELMLWRLFVLGVLPQSTTFQGYNYEILIGISALLVGYLGYQRRVLPRAVLLLWNCCGLATLAIVVFIFISHAYAPGIWADSATFSMAHFAAFPYTLLAGFLMPLAVFMHIFSIVKLLRHAGDK